MSSEKAKKYYSDKKNNKFNCAQAVIAAFKEKFLLDEKCVGFFAGYGGGRAPEGECGALYAAKYILKGKYPGKAAECEKAFIADAGSAKCGQIRKLNRIPCMGCVGKAAEFLDGVEGGAGRYDEITPSSGLSLEQQVRVIAGGLVLSGIIMAWLVHWAFIFIPVFVSCGLIYAGLTDNCMMGMLLMKLPYNKK